MRPRSNPRRKQDRIHPSEPNRFFAIHRLIDFLRLPPIQTKDGQWFLIHTIVADSTILLQEFFPKRCILRVPFCRTIHTVETMTFFSCTRWAVALSLLMFVDGYYVSYETPRSYTKGERYVVESGDCCID